MSADVIDAAELAQRLAGPMPPVVLDIRWSARTGSDPQGFRDGHIPGARYVDLDAELAGPPGTGGRHPLPEPAALQAV